MMHRTTSERQPDTVGLLADSSGSVLPQLVAVLAGLLAFRIAALALNRTDLFFDEAQYWAWSLEPAFGYYSKPPLVAWIIAAATAVCGDGEFCVRLPSPILHTLTAFVVYLIGRRLYSQQVGFWAAVAYATLPAVSLSAGIISTDVPLLLAWALALLFLAIWLDRPAWGPALALGAALGLGLNAKYVMILFVLCAAVYFAIERRGRLREPSLWAALLIGFLLIAPNLWWNWDHGLATFAHTADNAKWTGRLFRPDKAAEFFLAQFGVMGPVLFAAFLAFLWQSRRTLTALAEPDRLLLAFSAPIILLFTLQAFISRAHANWAATAYIAAPVLVTAVLLRNRDWRWIKGSLALHLGVALLIAFGTWRAGTFQLPVVGDPFARTLGWRQVADAARQSVVEAQAKHRPLAAIIANERETMAALLYYFRDRAVPVYAWRGGTKPRHHFELTRPYHAKAGEPALLVSLSADGKPFARAFAHAERLASRPAPAGQFAAREVYLFTLSGYKGR